MEPAAAWVCLIVEEIKPKRQLLGASTAYYVREAAATSFLPGRRK